MKFLSKFDKLGQAGIRKISKYNKASVFQAEPKSLDGLKDPR